ncbi:E3 ubiquitin-protein ligase RGLG2-like [Malania oleifera]|uniref:E3 ubiquitin-protein ligase RGLG2-like n=1 Tax=Malania oleifera TaxID=397392 RepID=UPI0025AEA2AC|nr:E3 ubiquitin-protein ligase RGLG2-like [Malania oleifera]XP_057970485.1 E3 ubiquitin-protein ligase RGLG2-like [Malania oleifera]XP_057970487.1 E3 ubiquitin-protein ligase RGLG2-like [Malania oleifera]XP_057970488.1 E3 ubiquitin-protein ligase RGLG2-like [Malania oleifera]XP_057970489.1 E3 ubiquitin-protein ligase RGLG2-like [Malania oleifera]XP_057970490.1 E3 ubiquitin-protein ligase RGLG2-like [Malania oleifera]XP_057970491.1 E3 ubiquitin-protein ligase RGLG2-like [Malania oleifera]XP_0
MGGRISKGSSRRHSSSFGSSSHSWGHHGYPQPPYAQPSQHYVPRQHVAPPSQSYGGWAPESKRKLDRKYSKIDDDYSTLEQVTDALARAGLESSNLIVGIDFTKSNEWTGARSFHRRSLHDIGDDQNPYEQAISIIGKTLSTFDEDNLIPCFGFGDASTHDQEVFSFYPDERFCNGFEEVLQRYRELVPQLRLAGPTSFAPIIEMAITIVEQSGGQYHVLLIIADGQVTRSIDTKHGHLSPQEMKTVEAIVKASEYPLSIVLVGVGDGPWDMMREFDDNIPARAFDNFQFVNFTEIMSKNVNRTRKEAEFSLAALMEIPSQYKATLELNILGVRRGKAIDRVPLPPPRYGSGSFSTPKPSRSSSFHTSESSSAGYHASTGWAQPQHLPADNHVCPICLTNPKDMAFGCGHQTCCECGQDLDLCPICRSTIQARIKLY